MGVGKVASEESAATATTPELCESAVFGGTCKQVAHYLVSYGGGDSFPSCLAHIMLQLEETRTDPDFQHEEWVISYL